MRDSNKLSRIFCKSKSTTVRLLKLFKYFDPSFEQSLVLIKKLISLFLSFVKKKNVDFSQKERVLSMFMPKKPEELGGGLLNWHLGLFCPG